MTNIRQTILPITMLAADLAWRLRASIARTTPFEFLAHAPRKTSIFLLSANSLIIAVEDLQQVSLPCGFPEEAHIHKPSLPIVGSPNHMPVCSRGWSTLP